MSLRFAPSTLAVAFIAALSLVAIPACKKPKKPAEPDSPTPTPPPGPSFSNPNPGSNTGGRDPEAPRSPVFGTSDPRTAAMRQIAENNLKQILLALHNYHDTYGGLPAGFADQSGKPGLSWRVAILPFLEHDTLYRQFKLDEPWDSPNNKALISQMPPVYAPPRESTRGYTFYRGFTGPNTWLPPQQQPGRAGQPLFGVKLFQISDGTSNTILVAEAYDPVIWTKPDELQFTPGNPPRLGGVFASGFCAGMADTSVKFVRPGIDSKTLSNAIQINDGNAVNLDQ